MNEDLIENALTNEETAQESDVSETTQTVSGGDIFIPDYTDAIMALYEEQAITQAEMATLTERVEDAIALMQDEQKNMEIIVENTTRVPLWESDVSEYDTTDGLLFLTLCGIIFLIFVIGGKHS